MSEESADDVTPDDQADDDDITADVIDLETQKRLWLRAMVPLLQLRKGDSDESDRVQYALDLMHIAACERVARILRSDLAADQG
jgi:hypothetical protein